MCQRFQVWKLDILDLFLLNYLVNNQGSHLVLSLSLEGMI